MSLNHEEYLARDALGLASWSNEETQSLPDSLDD